MELLREDSYLDSIASAVHKVNSLSGLHKRALLGGEIGNRLHLLKIAYIFCSFLKIIANINAAKLTKWTLNAIMCDLARNELRRFDIKDCNTTFGCGGETVNFLETSVVYDESQVAVVDFNSLGKLSSFLCEWVGEIEVEVNPRVVVFVVFSCDECDSVSFFDLGGVDTLRCTE